jgi:hypothetical protein
MMKNSIVSTSTILVCYYYCCWMGLFMSHCVVSSFAPTMIAIHQRPCDSSPQQKIFPSTTTACFMATTSDNDDLLEKARKLRQDAQQMERELRATKPAPSEASTRPPPVAKVTRLEDSVWTVSYRFSILPKKDNDDETMIIPNYSGKVTIRLRADGYSELVASSEDSKLQMVKVWGWDEESSPEDDLNYLLFSIDVMVPKTDPTKLANQKERYYFQARIDRSSSTDNSIQLQEGTVTVKQDLSEKTNGRWGFFQVGGILTEFVYVGDFVAKPSIQ